VLTVLIRSYFLVGRIKPSHTWVLWLTLVAVGSAVPYIVDYFVFFNEHYRSRAPEIDWWLLPNPFAAVLDVLYESRYSSVVFESRGLLFSSVWAVLMIIAAIPWYAKQVLHFHPPLVTPTSGGRKSLDQQRPHQSAHTARPSTEISR